MSSSTSVAAPSPPSVPSVAPDTDTCPLSFSEEVPATSPTSASIPVSVPISSNHDNNINTTPSESGSSFELLTLPDFSALNLAESSTERDDTEVTNTFSLLSPDQSSNSPLLILQQENQELIACLEESNKLLAKLERRQFSMNDTYDKERRLEEEKVERIMHQLQEERKITASLFMSLELERRKVEGLEQKMKTRAEDSLRKEQARHHETRERLSQALLELEALPLLRAQVEVYQADFSAERAARERIAGEKADLEQQLRQVKTGNFHS